MGVHCADVRVLRAACATAGELLDRALDRFTLALRHGGAHEALEESIADLGEARLLIAVEERERA